MGDYLKKVKSGQPLNIPAAAYNAFIEAAEDLARRRADQTMDGRDAHRSSGLIRVKNASGAARPRFGVLGLSGGPLFYNPADLNPFKREVVFRGVTPATSDRFAILQEPAADGAIARAIVSGVTPVQIVMYNSTHKYAGAGGDATKLFSAADSGEARILWFDPAGSYPAVHWAIVRVGGGGGGGVGVLWGTTPADWAGENQITVTVSGVSWTVYLTTPLTGSPIGLALAAGQEIAFIPYDTANRKGIALPIGWVHGTHPYQVLQWTSAGIATWDWVRGHP